MSPAILVIDDNPKKWNYYTPGAKMRVTGISEIANTNVDFLLLLAWNFQTEIMQRCKNAHYKGKYIVPVPEPQIIL